METSPRTIRNHQRIPPRRFFIHDLEPRPPMLATAGPSYNRCTQRGEGTST